MTKTFGSHTVLKDISFDIPRGQITAVMGPSGTGKSVLLKNIIGLLRPDDGEIWVEGEETVAMGERDLYRVRRKFGVLFQDGALFGSMTMFDNMAFPLRAPGRRSSAEAIRRRVHEIAEMLRIESKLKNRATELSGGEMQRVSIGRALVREPNMFLMDEPLSSLDAKLREDLRVELKRIQRELGATILYVTHDQLEAMTLADRIGVLSEGRLIQIDAPRRVYERPTSIYAAQRLGSPPINLLGPGSLGITGGPAGTRILGVRPEDVVLNGAGVPARVLTLEHLGVESIALLQVEGAGGAPHRLHALLGGQRGIAEGDRVSASVRPGAVLYFDAEGRRLGAGETS